MKRHLWSFVKRAMVVLWLVMSSACQAEEPIRAAVFKGDGVGQSVEDLLQALEQNEDQIVVGRITADQIREGGLADFDVLIHPGGSGSRQGKALGQQGREEVRRFLRSGGGFLGVCAGSYLATNQYSWSLNLIDAKVVDRRHWARGNGTVELQLSPTGASFFGHVPKTLEIHYAQGPLLARREWDDPAVPDYQSLACFNTEIAKNGAPEGIMVGTSAIVRANYGSGRVFCFSPHPELTDGQESMINHAVHWLVGLADEQAVEFDGITPIVRRHFPSASPGGVAVLVTERGNVLHRKAYGFVKGRRLTTHTPLSLASVTKQFAAMCAAMLIEENRLDREQTVSHYLPELELPSQGRAILVKDLLYHTSGLPNFIKAEERASIAEFKCEHGLDFLTNKTHAEWLTTMDLRRPPGQEHEYTNSGYVLLTRIIEEVTGESFHDFQKRRIFDVLGMTETTDSTRFNGSGNMRTTLVDYTKWDRALWEQDPRILSPAGYEMLFQQGLLDDGTPVDYGFGWRLKYRDGELLIAEHGGVGSGTTAARNLIRRHFDEGITIAIFAQENPELGRADRARFASELYECVLKRPE
ncbi:serine hydrolase [Rubinisphaera margarita]|uniref:serine hydrolase n=1 Tax=Rubinisphaera margarita TaxID=2909586 RepID=UPI001EE95194|nr:serine hydrolase [Rubinisphaera margarita]MCG6158129.1 serine hydrolase [Rubinisphaera margarita]